MQLNLSQDLTIQNCISISVPGETDKYYSTCNEFGMTDFNPGARYDNGIAWYALTEKAKEVWKGDTKINDGITLGKVIEIKDRLKDV